MKVTDLLLPGLTLLLVISVIELHATRCDRLEWFDLSFSESTVKDDLTSGTWEVSVGHTFGKMYFFEDGRADLVNAYYDGDEVETFTWRVEMKSHAALLVVGFPDGKTRNFRLVPTCDGFAVTTDTGVRGGIEKIIEGSSARLDHLRMKLKGEWTSVARNKRDRSRIIKWQFHENGEFRFAVSPDFTHSVLKGIWDITPDGEHVMLFFTLHENPETVYATELLDVRGLDFEDMILTGDTFSQFVDYRKKDMRVFFQKDNGA